MHGTFPKLIFAALIASSSGIALGQASTLSRAVVQSESRQSAVPHPNDENLAEQKLADLARRTGKRPNVIWIVVDDMGWGDPGAYGGGEAIGAATPNMDRLAAAGLKLTSAYSQPTCTPTRSAMLTGRLPARTGLTRPIVAGDKLTANPWADEVSVAKLLSDAGYTTIHSGKWHIGELPGMRPFEIGYDEFYGFYPAQKELSQSFDERRYPDLVLDPEKLEAYRKVGASHALVRGAKGGDEQVVEQINSLEQIAEADRKLTDYTVGRLKALARSNKPFFLQHAFMKVHADNFPSKAFRGASRSKFQYKDSLVEVDAYIGEIVRALAETGLDKNTLVFITSDNGPQMDAWPDAGNTPFRSAKGTTWEGGVRVPAIAYWKGMIKPGRVSDDLFDLMDMFNTTLAICGAAQNIPTDRYIDGIDQSSFFLAENGRSNRDKIFMWDNKSFMALRMYEYKMHVKVAETKAPFLDIDMVTVNDVGAPWLFNLYIDPKETYPVGHRMNAWAASMGAEIKAHLMTFKKYPPKSVGLDR